jgi:hypothetical protein
MKRRALFLALLCMVGLTGPASALICTIDDVPAATLLLPYFEVANCDETDGITTLFSINNASATAVLAHVVVWSDLSVPVLDFNIYLTGYDVQTINLRDIICDGVLPRTASDGQDPQDTISPQGDFSQDINFASCTGQLPPPTLPASFVDHLQASLTGQSSPILGNRCAGRNLGDNVARGYVTVDTVNNCTLRFPGDAGYFAPGGQGDVTNQNVLWGDYFYVSPADNFAQGETLVHIEASPGTGTSGLQGTYPAPGDPETTVAGEYTFYGRYVAWTAADNREPLATNFAQRFVNGGAFDGGTQFICWRDSKVNQGPFTCPAAAGVRPPWFALGQEGLVIFDEQENPDVPTAFPVSPQPPTVTNLLCPAEAQRTVIGGADFPVIFDFGWIYANLNQTNATAGPNPPEDPLASQAWLSAVMDAQGRFSVGFDAIQLDSACNALHFAPGLVPQ